MKLNARILEEARRLGFQFVRNARHGELWRHPSTGRSVSIVSRQNAKRRCLYNQLATLKRAAG